MVVPWGLVLSVGGSASVVLLARSVGRGLGFVAAGGWVVGVGVLLLRAPDGSYLLRQDNLTWGFLLAATVAVIGSASWGSAET